MNDFTRVIKLKLEEELLLHNKLETRLKQLKKYDGDILHVVYRQSRVPMYYVHHQNESRGVRHYCDKSKLSQIKDIQEYIYLKKAIHYSNRNIQQLETLLQEYHPAYPDDITPELGKAYQDQEQIKAFLFKNSNSETWLKQNLEAKARYRDKRPDKYEASLTQRTIDGNYTRSKSELDIYHLLLRLGCTFIYEMPIQLYNKMYVCDFLVLLPEGKTLIIEHMGLAGNPGYLASKLDTIDSFIRSGWIPNVNLLLTFEDAAGNIDMQAISKLIVAYVK